MQLRMGPGRVFLIRGDAGWIVLAYRLDHIVSAGLYRIVWISKHWIYALAGYSLDGMDGLDGALVGRGWDGPKLAPAGTGAPPLPLEGKRSMVSGGWEKLRWCCKYAE